MLEQDVFAHDALDALVEVVLLALVQPHLDGLAVDGQTLQVAILQEGVEPCGVLLGGDDDGLGAA